MTCSTPRSWKLETKVQTISFDRDFRFRVRVLSDLEAVSREGTRLFAQWAQEVVDAKGRFVVALSGGKTPLRLFSLLSSEPSLKEIKWPCVHFFWVDERCVPPQHDESNYKAAWDHLLSRISVPESNIHRIRGEDDPSKEAQRYEEELRRFFAPQEMPTFDLVLLGLGEDGHTASLFPGSPALKEKERLVLPVFLGATKKNRITLTLPVLDQASRVLFLVSGSPKADVVKEVLGKEGGVRNLPASLVRPSRGSVEWLIDRAAAAKWLELLAGKTEEGPLLTTRRS